MSSSFRGFVQVLRSHPVWPAALPSDMTHEGDACGDDTMSPESRNSRQTAAFSPRRRATRRALVRTTECEYRSAGLPGPERPPAPNHSGRLRRAEAITFPPAGLLPGPPSATQLPPPVRGTPGLSRHPPAACRKARNRCDLRPFLRAPSFCPPSGPADGLQRGHGTGPPAPARSCSTCTHSSKGTLASPAPAYGGART